MLEQSTSHTMVQLSAFFITLLTAASLAATGTASIVRRTVAQVEADIATIGKQLNSLDASIKAFPTSGGTLPQALVCIHVIDIFLL